ncbi:MAG: VOC family protein [Candidatus Phosphoribacter sp.]
MTITLSMVTTDSTDPTSLATWWAEQTGARIFETNDGYYVMVKGGGLPVVLAFQLVEEVTPGKNRLHMDLSTQDLDAETDRLLAAGATLVERRGDDNFRWVTLADPQGNQFCVAGVSETG